MGKNHRYNIRLDPHIPEHMEVERLFQEAARGGIRELIVDAVLSYSAGDHIRMDKADVQEIVQSTVRSTLEALDIQPGHGADTAPKQEQASRTEKLSEEVKKEPVDPDVADLVNSGLRGFDL